MFDCLVFQEAELVKDHLLLLADKQPDLSCDCPAQVHDKERPLELEDNINTGDHLDNINYGYSSHFDF